MSLGFAEWLAVALFVTGQFNGSAAAQADDAVILRDDICYEVLDEDKARFSRHRVLRAENADGAGYGQIVMEDSELYRLKEFSGEVRDADGNLLFSCDEDNGRKRCGYEQYSLYADVCERYFDLSSSSYPFEVEYEYIYEFKSPAFWPRWRPEAEIPVVDATYTLIVPNDFHFHIKEIGNIVEPEIVKEDDQTIWRWRLPDLPPIVREDCSPANEDFSVGIDFAPLEFEFGGKDFDGSSWQTLSSGYSELVSDSDKLDGVQEELVEEILSGNNSAGDILHEVDKYIKKNMRYVAIQIGVGGWIPSDARETCRRGYGDCKDLATAFSSLLNYAGLESRCASLLTRLHGKVDPDLPALFQFNHVISFVVTGNDTVWHDPTCMSCQPGDLPFADENTYALVIDPKAGGLILTPASTAEDNVIVKSAHCKLSGARNLAVSVHLRATGNPRHRLSSLVAKLEQDELPSYLTTDLFGLGDNLRTDSVQVDTSSSEAEIDVWLHGQVRGAVRQVGGKAFVSTDFLDPISECELVDASNRVTAVDLRYPRTYIDSLWIDIPDTWQLTGSTDTSFNAEFFGTFSISYGNDKGRFLLARKRTVERYRIEKAELLPFASHTDLISKKSGRHVVFKLQ
jgi:transglutaminase-like putative cysteine protease